MTSIQYKILLAFALFQVALGHSRFMRMIPGGTQVPHPCRSQGMSGTWSPVGHADTNRFSEWNAFGNDFRSYGLRWSVELCQKDSDGDGLTNGEELGDPSCTLRDFSSATPIGHPGFCEPDRISCNAGSSYHQCRNRNERGHGQRPRGPPPGSNKHPQSIEADRLGMQQGGMRPHFQQQPQRPMFRPPPQQSFPMMRPANQFANDMPNLRTFQANLNQRTLQGRQGTGFIPSQSFRGGMSTPGGGMAAPGGGMAPSGGGFGGMSMGSMQGDVMRRMEMAQRSTGPSGGMFPMGRASGGSRPGMSFGPMEMDMGRAPMRTSRFMMDRSSSMMRPGPMGYPPF